MIRLTDRALITGGGGGGGAGWSEVLPLRKGGRKKLKSC